MITKNQAAMLAKRMAANPPDPYEKIRHQPGTKPVASGARGTVQDEAGAAALDMAYDEWVRLHEGLEPNLNDPYTLTQLRELTDFFARKHLGYPGGISG